MAREFDAKTLGSLEHRGQKGPPIRKRLEDDATRFNDKVALWVTAAVGTMWCAYSFAVLAFVALPSALSSGDVLPLIQWISQTFIQLVMLSVIMVGQNIMGRASDKRAEMTYNDADATFHEAEQIQTHLAQQDVALNQMLDKVAALEAALARLTAKS